MSKESRDDKIFRLIGEGKRADEIKRILEEGQERSQQILERGKESELIAQERIEKLPFVTKATRHKRFSPPDMHGHDLSVSLNQQKLESILEEELSISKVFVQVKSSHKGMLRFRSQFGRTEQEIDEHLAQKKIVLLNARCDEEKFTSGFIEQIKTINRHHSQNY